MDKSVRTKAHHPVLDATVHLGDVQSPADPLRKPRPGVTLSPVDMWTIGFQPNGCASHAYRARKGAESMEMLAFAHIPTGNRNNKEGFLILIFKEGESGAGGSLQFHSPALRESVRSRAPSRIKRRGRYFLPRERGQKIFRSRGPARAFDRARRRAAYVERRVGTEGWAFSDRT